MAAMSGAGSDWHQEHGVFHMGGRSPGAWAVFQCLPGALAVTQTQDSGIPSGSLAHKITLPALSFFISKPELGP